MRGGRDGPESLSTLSLRSADVGACDQEAMHKKIIVFYPTYETYDRYAKPDQTDIYI
jgi:hypothetical protein